MQINCYEAMLRESNSFSGSRQNQTIVEIRDSQITESIQVSDHTHLVRFQTPLNK